MARPTPEAVTPATPVACAHGIQLADALIGVIRLDGSSGNLCTANAKHFRPIGSLMRVAFRP